MTHACHSFPFVQKRHASYDKPMDWLRPRKYYESPEQGWLILSVTVEVNYIFDCISFVLVSIDIGSIYVWVRGICFEFVFVIKVNDKVQCKNVAN